MQESAYLQVKNSPTAILRHRRHSDTAMSPNVLLDNVSGGSQGRMMLPFSREDKYCHCDQTMQDMTSRHRSCCYHFHQHHQCHLKEHQCPQSSAANKDNKLLRGFQEIGIDYLKMHGGFKFLGGGFKQLKRVDVTTSVDQHQGRKPSESEKEVNFDFNQKNEDSADNLYSPISHSYNNDLADDKIEIRPKGNRLGIRDSVSGRGNGPLKQTRNIGWRLRARKVLNEKRKRIADYALVFAMFGLLTMILEMELSMAGVYNKESDYSIMMKSLISVSTCFLIGMILAYHIYEIQLFAVNNCIGDWRIAMNCRRIMSCSLEVLVCLFHPIPCNLTFNWSLRIDRETSNREVTVDLILSLPMFLRLYLIFRVMLLHSRMFTDASSRSIGALNRVKFNIRFVLKTLMTICPGTILIVFILSLWVILSWIMRACERIHDYEHNNILNTMYLVAITFFSIGYGDMVPHTYCGRGISVLTGVMGSSCTALVVAVFARKLELKRAEKHVHNFMTDNRINKKLRNAAANVLRETWLFYKYTKLVKRVNPSKVRSHQRKFLRAIHNLRAAKESQRKLKDESNTLVDLAKTQSNIYDTVTLIRGDQDFLQHRVEAIEDNIKTLTEQVSQLPNMLREAMNQKE